MRLSFTCRDVRFKAPLALLALLGASKARRHPPQLAQLSALAHLTTITAATTAATTAAIMATITTTAVTTAPVNSGARSIHRHGRRSATGEIATDAAVVLRHRSQAVHHGALTLHMHMNHAPRAMHMHHAPAKLRTMVRWHFHGTCLWPWLSSLAAVVGDLRACPLTGAPSTAHPGRQSATSANARDVPTARTHPHASVGATHTELTGHASVRSGRARVALSARVLHRPLHHPPLHRQVAQINVQGQTRHFGANFSNLLRCQRRGSVNS